MFKIVNAVDFVDLRTLYVRAASLEGIAKKHKLRHGEALLFTNANLTRFRLVANVHGIAHLFIPGTDAPKEYVRYHTTARLYLQLTQKNRQRALREVFSVAQTRLDRLAERAARATSVEGEPT